MKDMFPTGQNEKLDPSREAPGKGGGGGGVGAAY